MLRDKLRRPDKIYSESLNRRDEQSNCMEDPVPGSLSLLSCRLLSGNLEAATSSGFTFTW